MERSTTIVAGTAVLAGILVIFGWFTIPVRLVLLLGLAAALVVMHGRSVAIRRWQFLLCPASLIAILPLTLLAAAAITILAGAGTVEPMRSPWPHVPSALLALFGLLACTTAMLAWTRPRIAALGATLTLLIAAFVAILVYPIGFGFDHFLHAAAEGIVHTTGGLTPPPYFYSAHYGLVALVATLGIPVALADRLLVPLLAACFLVPLAYRTLGRYAALALLLIPFFPFAVSTPQALSYVFALAAVLIISSPASRGGARGGVVALLAAAALLANPLTGIPVACAVLATVLMQRRRALGIVAALGGVVALPLAFRIASLLMPAVELRIGFSLTPLRTLGDALRDTIIFRAEDFATADALAIAHVTLPMLWVVLAVRGARLRPRTEILPPLIALGAAAAVFLTTTIPTLRAAEQTDFPLRLLVLAAILALPLVSATMTNMATRLRSLPERAAAALTFATLATFTLLLAYPRDDAQTRSGLWNVTADDIAAVHAIAADAGDARYVVLANQMLGAAAVREFGFRPSYRVNNTEHLAFPLPAGGPIAQQYWEYVGQEVQTCSPPSPRTRGEGGQGGERWCMNDSPITTAASLVNATRAYVVLHDYWTNYAAIAPATAAIADAEIGTFAHLRVFRFDTNR
ncbi:MAG: hypothetical protein Q7T01_01555 [bacterium]|nr:hypothetical protein [bacterium]